MQMTSDVNVTAVPYYMNCKEGFVKFTVTYEAGIPQLVFMGHTRNLRTATPIYGTAGEAMFVAKQLMRMAGVSMQQYFVLVQAALIGFNKQRERD